MLRIHAEIVSDRHYPTIDLGWLLIGNHTHGLQDPDGNADYTWAYYPANHPATTPTQTGEVHRHRRDDGWERLAANILTELANRRANNHPQPN